MVRLDKAYITYEYLLIGHHQYNSDRRESMTFVNTLKIENAHWFYIYNSETKRLNVDNINTFDSNTQPDYFDYTINKHQLQVNYKPDTHGRGTLNDGYYYNLPKPSGGTLDDSYYYDLPKPLMLIVNIDGYYDNGEIYTLKSNTIEIVEGCSRPYLVRITSSSTNSLMISFKAPIYLGEGGVIHYRIMLKVNRRTYSHNFSVDSSYQYTSSSLADVQYEFSHEFVDEILNRIVYYEAYVSAKTNDSNSEYYYEGKSLHYYP
jgi:hypothetical protein